MGMSDGIGLYEQSAKGMTHQNVRCWDMRPGKQRVQLVHKV